MVLRLISGCEGVRRPDHNGRLRLTKAEEDVRTGLHNLSYHEFCEPKNRAGIFLRVEAKGKLLAMAQLLIGHLRLHARPSLTSYTVLWGDCVVAILTDG